LNSLPTYTSITGALTIQGNDINDLSALSSLASVGENLQIQSNSILTNLDGLSSLTSVGGSLYVQSNAALTNLGGLSSLASVGEILQIQSNDALTNLDGLSSITSVGGSLYVQSNAALTNLDGLSSLTSIGEILQIQSNSILINLDGLSSLASVGGSLYIQSNAALTNLGGLSSLASVGEILQIQSNDVLTNLDGLSSITSVGGSLYVQSNAALTNLDGLSSITSVGEILQIQSNSILTNLDGLSSLTSVGGSLYVQSNAALTNLDGLSSLTSVGEILQIQSNDVLSSFCGLYPLINGSGLTGSYTVTGNASNPTEQEIIDGGACAPTEPLSVVVAGQNISCPGAGDGAAYAIASGGTPDYTYAWDGGETEASISDLAPGEYCVTVTDANGDTATACYTITEPVALTVIADHTEISCNEGADGTAKIFNLQGGTPSVLQINSPYAISLNSTRAEFGTQTYDVTADVIYILDDTASYLGCIGYAAGSMTGKIAMIDRGDCNFTIKVKNAQDAGAVGVIIVQSFPGQAPFNMTGVDSTIVIPSMMISVEDAAPLKSLLAHAMAVSATLKSGGYQYLWSTGETTETITGLSAGTYTLTVTDEYGCTATASTELTDPPALTASASGTDLSFNGSNDGTATVTVSGGNLNCRVSNLYNSSSFGRLVGTLPFPPFTVVTSGQNFVACNTGNITAIAVELNITGEGNLELKIAQGIDTESPDYTETVTLPAVTGNWLINLAEPFPVVAGETYAFSLGGVANSPVLAGIRYSVDDYPDGNAFTEIGQSLDSDFSFEIRIEGTEHQSLTYLWSNGDTTETITGLAAGTYDVEVTDAKGCTASASVTLQEPLSVVVAGQNISCPGAGDGAAFAIASGGTPDYTYAWDSGETDSSISDLASGEYCVTVTDANGDTASACYTIAEPVALTVIADHTEIGCNGGADGTASIFNLQGGTPSVLQVNSPYALSLISTRSEFGPQTYDVTADVVYIQDDTASYLGCIGYAAGSMTGKLAMIDRGDCLFVTKVKNAQDAGAVGVIMVQSFPGQPPSNMSGVDSTIVIPTMMISVEDAAHIKSLLAHAMAVSATLKSGGYQYLWSTGDTTETITGLSAGTYTLTVTDEYGCTATASTELTNPPALAASASGTDLNCTGSNDGTATVSVSGGNLNCRVSNLNNSSSFGRLIGVLPFPPFQVITSGQNFVACNTGNITAIAVDLNITGEANVELKLAQGIDTETPDYSEAVALPAVTGNWLINLAEPFPVVAGETYAFSLGGIANSPVLAGIRYSEDDYPEGNAFTEVGQNPDSDFSFEIRIEGTEHQSLTYLWSTGDTTETISGLAAGTYDVEVTNANGCTAAASVTLTEPDGLGIDLQTGWSIISSYFQPDNPDLENIFASLNAENKVSFMFGQNGIYWPGENINTLGNWDVFDGYKIKMNQPGCINITGEMPEDKTVSLPSGTYFMPMLCEEPVPADDIFAELGNNLLYAFDLQNSLVYWPQGGIYTLQTLEPGTGYLVNMLQQGEVVFNCAKSSVYNYEEAQPIVYPNAPWSYEKTGSAHLISISSEALGELSKGDYIGVFTEDGDCAGLAQYNQEAGNILLVAYGDDFTTEILDGLMDNETMSFRIYSPSQMSETEFAAEFATSMPNSGSFADNGRSMILKFAAGATAIQENIQSNINIYPNPAKDIVNISLNGDYSEATVVVYNPEGREVINQIFNGQTEMNVSSLEPGFYFVRISTNTINEVRKLVIK